MKKMAKISPGQKVGILGGGQLARMLALNAHRLGLIPCVYSQSPKDPAAIVTSQSWQGDLQDQSKITEFMKNCDVVTFESEFLNGSMLAEISKKLNKPIHPDPLLVGTIQDRLYQKEFFLKYKLVSTPHLPVNSVYELNRALHSFKGTVVLKKRLFGYDGYGTYFLDAKKAAQLKPDFFSSVGYIAEPKISFDRELALIIARDQFGNFIHYPLVESHQTQARCDWICGPQKHKQLKGMIGKLKKLLDGIKYVGVMGVELFETQDGLVINEIAPRVHNTGHYTESACDLDQFTLHMMCIAGYEISQPRLISPGFAMVNLLGSSSNEPQWSSLLTTPLFWYGKTENRAGRKMGHLNSIDKTPLKALKLALKARGKFNL